MSRKVKSIRKELKEGIYIFVEGESEERYFERLKKHLNLPRIKTFKMDDSGISLLRKSKLKMNNDARLVAINQQNYLVFDKDNMKNDEFNEVQMLAEKENFTIGFSNIAFEVWLLAHFEKVTKGQMSNDMLKKKLSGHLKQEYKKADSKQIEKMIASYKQAIKNAEGVNEIDFDYQCTTVGAMIKDILG